VKLSGAFSDDLLPFRDTALGVIFARKDTGGCQQVTESHRE
jgi:hypothetical protein